MSAQNLSVECVDAWRGKIKDVNTRLYWIGNYYDNDVYDDSEVSAETIDILVNKCANIFKDLQLENKPIILYLPNVLQLPIAALAALRIGLPFLPISANNEDVDCLRSALKDSNADCIVTVDGFWMGTRLIKTKEILDEAIAETAVRRVLVIRHVCPNEGIPPPHKHLIGRRPYYLYKAKIREDRDSLWNRFFHKVSSVCNAESLPSESTALLLPSRNGLSLAPVSVQKLRAEMNHIQTVMHPDELILTISTADILQQIICSLATLRIGAIPLIYEGDIKHPDPSRISQIIYTYKVEKLLLAENDLKVLLNYKQYVTFWDLKTLNAVIILGSDKFCKDVKEMFGVPCRNVEVGLKADE